MSASQRNAVFVTVASLIIYIVLAAYGMPVNIWTGLIFVFGAAAGWDRCNQVDAAKNVADRDILPR